MARRNIIEYGDEMANLLDIAAHAVTGIKDSGWAADFMERDWHDKALRAADDWRAAVREGGHEDSTVYSEVTNVQAFGDVELSIPPLTKCVYRMEEVEDAS